MKTNTPQPNPSQPWYRFRMVWLVVAFPLAAVVMGVGTAVMAVRNPDPVLKVAPGAAEEAPAVEGRNHAATGGKKASAPQ